MVPGVLAPPLLTDEPANGPLVGVAPLFEALLDPCPRRRRGGPLRGLWGGLGRRGGQIAPAGSAARPASGTASAARLAEASAV